MSPVLMRPTYSSTCLALLPDAGTGVGEPISFGILVDGRTSVLPPQCSGGVCAVCVGEEPATRPCERLQRIGGVWPETSVKNATRQCESWYPDRPRLEFGADPRGIMRLFPHSDLMATLSESPDTAARKEPTPPSSKLRWLFLCVSVFLLALLLMSGVLIVRFLSEMRIQELAATRALAERTRALSGLWLSIQSYDQAVHQFVAQTAADQAADFSHLAQNSRRAVSDVGPRGLTIEVAEGKRRLFVRFRDSGPGIADRQRLFQPFESTTGGTGMGLYISRAILRHYGGDLKYEPQPAGACFTVELEAVEVSSD